MDWKFEKICIQYLTQGWNVNNEQEGRYHLGLKGLIEAYWNVNAYNEILNDIDDDGLIEAYWNVNSQIYQDDGLTGGQV